MKVLKFMCFLFVVLSCSKEDKGKENDLSSQDSISKYTVTISPEYSNENYIKDVLKDYIDSLNNFRSTDQIPSFVYDKHFDNRLKAHYWSLNNYISVKEKIFSYVDNSELFNSILSDSVLQKEHEKAKSSFDVVMLAKTRKEELQN